MPAIAAVWTGLEIPKRETFQSMECFYSTLFHELTHATGHESRLNLKGVRGSDGRWASFGSHPYAKEELVAEMGVAFLCGEAGIVERTLENSAAYRNAWLGRLKNDSRLVIQATGLAQKASDYTLGRFNEPTRFIREGVSANLSADGREKDMMSMCR